MKSGRGVAQGAKVQSPRGDAVQRNTPSWDNDV